MPKEDNIIFKEEKANDAKPQKEKKKKNHKVGMFFLGWFLGTIINIAIIVGFGVWFYKNGNLSTIEKTFGFEISVLGEDAKHLTFERLVGGIVDVAQNYDKMTIEEISEGIGLGLDDFLTVETVDDESVYKLMGLDVTSVIKGELRQAGVNMQSVMDELSLENIEKTFNIVLPSYEFINALKTTPLKDLSAVAAGLLDNYTLNKLSAEFGVSFNQVEMLQNFLDIPFSQLPEQLQDLYVRDVVDTTGATGVLKAIADYKISELAADLPNIQLGALFTESEINSNMILKRLKSTPISSLSTAINNIKINELYPDTTNNILIALGTYSITNLTTAFESLTISDVIDMTKVENINYVEGVDPEYKQYEAQGIWAFVDGETLLVNFGDININLAAVSLGRLQYEGLIDQTLDLETSFAGKVLSEYTLNEFLSKITEGI